MKVGSCITVSVAKGLSTYLSGWVKDFFLRCNTAWGRFDKRKRIDVVCGYFLYFFSLARLRREVHGDLPLRIVMGGS